MAHKFNYSTAGLPDGRSVESWREAMAEVYYRLDVRPKSADRVNGQLVDWQSDRIGISEFKADAQRVVRSSQAARHDRAESFVFLFPTQGPMQFLQRGKTGTAMPGEVFLLNSAEPYVVEVPDGSANITIKIESESIVERLPYLRDLCGTAGFANAHLVPASVMLASQILKLGATFKDASLETAIVDVVSAMVETGPGSTASAVYARPHLAEMLFKQLIAFVRAHLHNQALSPAIAASAHRISVRYLHKLFHDRGQSFGRRLLEERLKRSHQIITDYDGIDRISLSKVAFSCGFTSQAHFSSTYRNRFGETPSDACFRSRPASNP